MGGRLTKVFKTRRGGTREARTKRQRSALRMNNYPNLETEKEGGGVNTLAQKAIMAPRGGIPDEKSV